ncbi:MAG: HemK2/MTQ2 family protein methyltransferase, partial [Candidatus Woesearchaeota archaeon]
EVYPPREDSLFLKEYVKKFSRGNILDMGCGSGIQSKTALENNEVNKVISIDLNENALKKTSEIKDERLKVIKSDLFSSLNNKYYDFFNLIIFNPPYLPSSFNDKYLDKGTKLATVGGKKGNETIIRFIKKLNYFLKNKGTCLLLYSSKSRPKEIFNELRYNLLNYELLDKREMQDSEKLFIIKIEKKNVLKRINKKYKVDYLTKGSHSYVFLNQDNQLIKVTNNVSLGSIKKEYDICKYIENSSYNDKINIPKHYSIDSKNEFLVREYIKGEEFDKLIPNLDKSELKKIL